VGDEFRERPAAVDGDVVVRFEVAGKIGTEVPDV